ncbi:GNAT family N-acetyltransferase [Euzebya sp.]|uniref:GNAT family N-acetyltransferase n=1 Tax=Euzebya sp. TaxID=1971409 RepID=UPI0035180DCD
MSRVLRVGPEDWAAAREVRLAALVDSPDAFFSTHQAEVAQPEAFWRGRAADADAATSLWLDDDDRPRGMMTVIPHHADPSDGLLVAVWVDPDVRGRGAADELLDACTRAARGVGYGRLVLEVSDQNPRAIAFYRRAGFTPTGRTSRFPAPRAHITEQELALDLR